MSNGMIFHCFTYRRNMRPEDQSRALKLALHSMLTADSFTLGGVTTVDGTGVRPLTAISSTSGGKFPQVWFAASTNHSLMIDTTNSLSCKDRVPNGKCEQKEPASCYKGRERPANFCVAWQVWVSAPQIGSSNEESFKRTPVQQTGY